MLNSLRKDYTLNKKWTSQQLDKFQNFPARYQKQFIRLKHFNGSLYWNQQHMAPFIPKHYRNWFIYFFYQLIQQYSLYVPDFDIVKDLYLMEEIITLITINFHALSEKVNN